MDEGKPEGPSYIKPFSDVRQNSNFNYDYKKPREGSDTYKGGRNGSTEPQKDYRYERHADRSKERREGPEQLQPQVTTVSKHWYDEYPVEDRRKQIEESLKERKHRLEQEEIERKELEARQQQELERYKQYPKYEAYPKNTEGSNSNTNEGFKPNRDYHNYPEYNRTREGEERTTEMYERYLPKRNEALNKEQPVYDKKDYFNKSPRMENPDFSKSAKYEAKYFDKSPKYENEKLDYSPKFNNDDFDDIKGQQYQCRSYNRNMGISKRAFARPTSSNIEEFDRMPASHEEKYGGRSASHGFDRQFKYAPQPTFNIQPEENYSRCELKFNKKSVNYDMTEIELPAYCKNHPEGKLLYVITPEGKESELG